MTEAADVVVVARADNRVSVTGGAVIAPQLANSDVTTDKLADGAVTSNKILDGTIVNADINAAAGIAQTKIAGLADTFELKADKSTIGNLLTENVATGTDALGTTEGFNVRANCTVESSTATAWQGSRSLLITATNTLTAGTFGIAVGCTATTTTANVVPANGIVEVTPGESITLFAWHKAGGGYTGAIKADLFFFAANGTTPSSTPSVLGEDIISSSSEWTLVSVTAVVPADAARVAGRIAHQSQASVSAEGYFDGLSLHRGVGGNWTLPGIPVTNLISTSYLSAPASITLSRARPVVTATSGSVTFALPAVSGNAGVQFTIINRGTGTVTISGITGLTIPGTGMVQVISDGSSWLVLQGEYTTHSASIATTGKGTWTWDLTGWRLVAYDTGVRDVSGLLINGWTVAAGGHAALRRTAETLTVSAMLDASASTSSIFLGNQGTAFRPVLATYGQASLATAANQSLVALWQANGSARIYGATTPSVYVTLNAPTPADLPTSLPGTQLTAPV